MQQFLAAGDEWNLRDPITRELVISKAFCAIGIINCVLFGTVNTYQGRSDKALVIAVLATLMCGLMIYLRRDRNVGRITTIMLGLVFTYFVYLLFIGGNNGTGPYWFGIFPVVVFLTKGRTAGVIGTLMFVGVEVGIILAQMNGLIETALPTRSLAISIASVSMLAIIVSVYETIKTVIEDALRQSEQAQRHMAQHDNLTGLPNRKLLADRFSNALAAAKRHGGKMAILFIDLDNFKPINDKLGHDVGDMVLKEVALRLGSSFREMDTVARLGGDEFIVLLPEVSDAAAVIKLAEDCLAIIGRDIVFGAEICNTGASVGIALYPDQGAEFEVLLSRADDAMYKAKASGKNRFVIAL